MQEKPKRGEGGNWNWSSNPNIGAYILIGIGVLFLLGTMGIIGGILRLWPLLLIGLGVWVLMGRNKPVNIQHERFVAAVDGAESARVRLDLSVGETNVNSRVEAGNLIDADISYVGEVRFEAQGDTDKFVHLGQVGGYSAFMNPGAWFGGGAGRDLRWNVNLNPNVPTDLDINGGVGKSTIDLSTMHLTKLDINGSVGELNITLPANAQNLDARLQVGVGKMDVDIPAGSTVYARIKGGVGETNVSTPTDAAVRLTANTGIGDLNIAPRLVRISGSGNSGFGQKGTWETPGFSSAEHQIVIEYDGGIGQLRVR
jgi:hypothetical protein